MSLSEIQKLRKVQPEKKPDSGNKQVNNIKVSCLINFICQIIYSVDKLMSVCLTNLTFHLVPLFFLLFSIYYSWLLSSVPFIVST